MQWLGVAHIDKPLPEPVIIQFTDAYVYHPGSMRPP